MTNRRSENVQISATSPPYTIISINDHPDIRRLFADLPVVEVDYKYTVGGAENASKCVELIYGTWPEGVPQPRGYQEGLF